MPKAISTSAILSRNSRKLQTSSNVIPFYVGRGRRVEVHERERKEVTYSTLGADVSWIGPFDSLHVLFSSLVIHVSVGQDKSCKITFRDPPIHCLEPVKLVIWECECLRRWGRRGGGMIPLASGGLGGAVYETSGTLQSSVSGHSWGQKTFPLKLHPLNL